MSDEYWTDGVYRFPKNQTRSQIYKAGIDKGRLEAAETIQQLTDDLNRERHWRMKLQRDLAKQGDSE